MIKKLSHALLNTIAYFILEPRFKSGKWRIRNKCLVRLENNLLRLNSAYLEARELFNRIDICGVCNGQCCTGNYNRFSVYDHISHLAMSLEQPPDWNYRLHPTKSYAFNCVHKGLCPDFVPGKGCMHKYSIHPAVCVWWVCDKMKEHFTAEDVKTLKRVRNKIDHVHWEYAIKLLLGGMGKNGAVEIQ